MQEDLVGLLEEIIRAGVRAHAGETRFREPLLGFADAEHPDFLRLGRQLAPGHLLPEDLLPGARTVISFFLPFAAEVVRANRAATPCAREWAVGYTEANRLIARLSGEIQEALRARGHRAAWELPTHEFDRTTLRARWSHKSVARIAGLGEFGLHRMLITPAGCAGRFGSVVTDAVLRAPRLWRGQACLHLAGGRCRICVDRCPVGALSPSGFNRRRCHRHLEQVDAHWSAELGGVHDVCGKCATGPCSLAAPTAASGQ